MIDDGRWLLVAVLAVGLFVAAVVPGSGAATPGPLGILGLDKWLHVLGYGLFATAVTWADGRPRVGVTGAVLYGGVLELVQLGLDYRTASVHDGLANLVGALLGAGLYFALTRASEP